MKDGKVYSKTVSQPVGSLDTLPTSKEIAAKVGDCVNFTHMPLPRQKAKGMIEKINNFGQLGDVSELTRLLIYGNNP